MAGGPLSTVLVAVLAIAACVGLVYHGDKVAPLLQPYKSTLESYGVRGVSHAVLSKLASEPPQVQRAGGNVAAPTETGPVAACGINGKAGCVRSTLASHMITCAGMLRPCWISMGEA